MLSLCKPSGPINATARGAGCRDVADLDERRESQAQDPCVDLQPEIFEQRGANGRRGQTGRITAEYGPDEVELLLEFALRCTSPRQVSHFRWLSVECTSFYIKLHQSC